MVTVNELRTMLPNTSEEAIRASGLAPMVPLRLTLNGNNQLAQDETAIRAAVLKFRRAAGDLFGSLLTDATAFNPILQTVLAIAANRFVTYNEYHHQDSIIVPTARDYSTFKWSDIQATQELLQAQYNAARADQNNWVWEFYLDDDFNQVWYKAYKGPDLQSWEQQPEYAELAQYRTELEQKHNGYSRIEKGADGRVRLFVYQVFTPALLTFVTTFTLEMLQHLTHRLRNPAEPHDENAIYRMLLHAFAAAGVTALSSAAMHTLKMSLAALGMGQLAIGVCLGVGLTRFVIKLRTLVVSAAELVPMTANSAWARANLPGLSAFASAVDHAARLHLLSSFRSLGDLAHILARRLHQWRLVQRCMRHYIAVRRAFLQSARGLLGSATISVVKGVIVTSPLKQAGRGLVSQFSQPAAKLFGRFVGLPGVISFLANGVCDLHELVKGEEAAGVRTLKFAGKSVGFIAGGMIAVQFGTGAIATCILYEAGHATGEVLGNLIKPKPPARSSC